ncbi:MAG: hypothetical protein Q8905_07750 [Bacteroidota bacterium]|nr:hypothetical protein [Bacteroidota bacterium]
MHKLFWSLLIAVFASCLLVKAQKPYRLSSGEIIFSYADVNNNGKDINSILRFTCFFHAGEYWHFDFDNHKGLYTGLAIRNVGLITKEDSLKTKRRSYTLGIPLAFKIGDFKNNSYFYAGGEYEWLFNYKEKTFKGGNKTKFSEWFSNRTHTFIPSVFAGIQFPNGFNLKFKYYLNNFLNKNFVDDQGNKPYKNMDTHIFYVSVSFFLNKNSFKLKNQEVKEMFTQNTPY